MSLSVYKSTAEARTPWESLLFTGAYKDVGSSYGLFEVGQVEAGLRRVETAWKPSGNPKPAWDVIHQWMVEELEDLEPASLQKENLEAVSRGQVAFVVTGQQPGLLGGAALVYYKALTAVALAEKWSERLGKKVVPVFWIAGDDSDLRECNRLWLHDEESPPVPFALNQPDPGQPTPVYRRILGESVEDLSALVSHQWGPEVAEKLKPAMRPEFTFSRSFKRILQDLPAGAGRNRGGREPNTLGDAGLLFLDGGHPRCREVFQPAMEVLVNDTESFHRAFAGRTGQIQNAGLKPQVEVRENVVHAFCLEGGNRYRVLKDGSRFVRQGKPGVPLDVAALCREHKLSHDAVSRPVLMQMSLPVLGHVLGPHELAYFMQLPDVFQKFCGSAPLLHPRMSAMLLSGGDAAAFEALQLPPECLPGLTYNRLSGAIHEQLSKGSLPFWESVVAEQKKLAMSLDPKGWEGYRGGGFDNIHKKFVQRLEAFLDSYRRKLNAQLYSHKKGDYEEVWRAWEWLGEGFGQDRRLNLFSLMGRFGVEPFFNMIRSLDPLSLERQVVVDSCQ